MNEQDRKTVVAVLGAILGLPEQELGRMIGSETRERAEKLYHRLKYEPYCKEHGIKVEDMTEDDYINEYEERCRVSEWEDERYD